jgi:hypothetical protein
MADFKTTLIKDSRIADITDQLTYAVQSGASSNTYQQFSAVTSTNSSLTFNVQVPSENIIVNREVLIRTKLYFTLHITTETASPQPTTTVPIPIGVTAISYGITDSFAPFPLNQLFTTSSCQINNTNVSVNTQDVLPAVLQLCDQEDFQKYLGMTPVMPDSYYKYFIQATQNPNNPMSAYGSSQGAASLNPNAVWRVSNPGGAGYDNKLLPRGSFHIDDWIVYSDNADSLIVPSTDPTRFVVYVSATVTEPIMCLSPFIYGSPEYNSQGLVGINAMSFVFNIDSQVKHMWTSAFGTRVTLGWVNPFPTTTIFNPPSAHPQCFERAELLLNFLSTQPTDLISARNVVPYMDLPRYITRAQNAIAIAPLATQVITSNNIQINQLPDYFIVYARNPVNTQQQVTREADSFLGITNITVNLNNTSGLLSSATQQELWKISVANGSQQSFAAFQGFASGSTPVLGYTGVAPPSGPLPSSRNGDPSIIYTPGSVLVLSPAMDLSLPDYLTSGSIGQYNFAFNLTVQNNSLADVTPEIVVICVNSGIFTTIAGSSNVYTGILTKQMVLDTKTSGRDDPITSVQYRRSVGGNWFMNAINSLASNPLAQKIGNKAADVAMKKGEDYMMKKLGMGMSGGGRSGGGRSGGASSKLTMC